MILEALERQTGVYGVVNKGDTVEVTEELGKELLAKGNFKKASGKEETATPQQVSERNMSGMQSEPVHTDGTDREALNTDGRKLHDEQPQAVVEKQQEIEKAAEKEDKTAEGKQTKEDKSATTRQSK